MGDPFRVYGEVECGSDGYPVAWHNLGGGRGVKHLVREAAGNRCVRCGHPYEKGAGEWSPCDERCVHGPPYRNGRGDGHWWYDGQCPSVGQLFRAQPNLVVEAQWRILTVHHLLLGPEGKRDLRWWNLVALCQRDHLIIQRKVLMERPWITEHSEWFKPYAAGFYAWKYEGVELTREETMARLDELLDYERILR